MATIRTCSAASSGITSGSGFAIANTIASSFMRSRSAASTTPGPDSADEEVGALEHVRGPAAAALAVGALRVPALQRVHLVPVVAPDVDRAVRVAADDLADPDLQQHARDRDAGRAEADHRDLHVLEALAGDLQRVEQRRHHDHGRAVLVVVEDRDVEVRLQPVLDLEAARGGDVLEVDAAEAGRDRLHRRDDLVRRPSCRGRSGTRRRRRTPSAASPCPPSPASRRAGRCRRARAPPSRPRRPPRSCA